MPIGSGGCGASGNYRVERTSRERVGVGLAGSKAGQGELSVATKSLLGQGPWQRLARGIRRDPRRPAWLLPSQGPEGEGTPRSSVPITGPH